ncbi:hypothetical protein FACS1894199_06520 [Bacteroidia bacterium]|nr:hypothetical protein FACS1894199_06520 [Bacteroidia bacterium]
MTSVVQYTKAQKLQIDADFPGGNIKMLSIDGDTVKIKQDARDTDGWWFYWSFRVRGAEGRTLNFVFANDVIGTQETAVNKEAYWPSSWDDVISTRGPAVSSDGMNWHWLSNKTGASRKKFSYTFGADEKEVYFSQCINHTEKNLNLFLEKYKKHPALKVKTLCKSEKGRNVELLRIGKNKAPFKVFLSSRHHSGETMGTYAMEGIIETILSDTEDGKWLRDNVDFFMVPFVDKDGVEDGDQGKNRKPHDHNRDYIQRKRHSVKAITEQVPKWADGKPLFVMDLHCPWYRGNDESIYFFAKSLREEVQRFGAILEKERKGTIPYWERNNRFLPSRDPNLQRCDEWGATLPNAVFSATLEVSFANAEGDIVVDANSTRKLGNDLAHAIRAYLETLK